MDKNEIFYIGVGTVEQKKKGYVGRYFRAYCKQKRNSIWNRITSKSEYTVSILEEYDEREKAFDREKELIRHYGRISEGQGSLANITKGGDGAAGFTRTEQDKYNKSISQLSLEERILIVHLYEKGMTIREIAKQRNHCKKTISKILKNANIKINKYTVMREDGMKFVTEKEACLFMNCTRGYISMAISKSKKVLGFNWYKINETIDDEKEIKRLQKLGYKIEIL